MNWTQDNARELDADGGGEGGNLMQVPDDAKKVNREYDQLVSQTSISSAVVHTARA